MLKIILAAAALMMSVSVAHAELTPREAAAILTASVVEVNNGCTASKVGPHQYMTARHCVQSSMKIESRLHTMWPRSVLMAWQKKEDGKRKEDWAIVNTSTDTDDVASLTLGCTEEVYLGMPVAYAGYPVPTKFAFGMGHVTSILPMDNRNNNLDYAMDVAAAPGASGSPVISMDTGHVIGILTEGVSNRRIGAFMVGMEAISNLDICDNLDTALSRYGVTNKVKTRAGLVGPF